MISLDKWVSQNVTKSDGIEGELAEKWPKKMVEGGLVQVSLQKGLPHAPPPLLVAESADI